MKVLVITGDRAFRSGNPRFDLQAEAVESFEALYIGPGALWATPQRDFYDVVSTQDPFFRGLFGLFWARRLKARLNVQVHADFRAQSFLKRMIARYVLKRADSIRVVSERVKKQVEMVGVTAPITVLPIYIDLERFKAVERAPDNTPTILWTGRFEDEKDPLRAVSIFKEVCKQIPDATLIMLGSGSRELHLREAARGLPVEFPGWQDPLPYLARAHVVLSTSPAESYGASIVEALAAGVPVVSLDVGVAHEAGATVVSRGELASAVVTALRNRPMGRLALALFSPSEWAALWVRSLSVTP